MSLSTRINNLPVSALITEIYQSLKNLNEIYNKIENKLDELENKYITKLDILESNVKKMQVFLDEMQININNLKPRIGNEVDLIALNKKMKLLKKDKNKDSDLLFEKLDLKLNETGIHSVVENEYTIGDIENVEKNSTEAQKLKIDKIIESGYIENNELHIDKIKNIYF